MTKHIFTIGFYALTFHSFSQDSSKVNKQFSWVEHYNSGLDELKNDNYSKADSLLTLAITAGYKLKDTYSNRAVARKKAGNACGYYVDLAYAAKYGNKESNTIFWKEYKTKNTSLVCTKDIRIAVKDTQALITQYDTIKNITLTSVLNISSEGAFTCFKEGINRQDTSYLILATFQKPGYVDSDEDMFRFLQKKTKYPETEKRNNVQGKVFIEFTVDLDGTLIDIELYKGVKGGPGLDQEALRVVNLMPKWKPGKLNDKPVKVSYILPFSFRLS